MRAGGSAFPAGGSKRARRVGACGGLGGPRFVPLALRGFGGEGGDERLDLRPGRVECVSADLFGVNLDALDERLVEEPAFGRVGLQVGSLGPVGELKREPKSLENVLLLYLVALQELFSGHTLPAYPLLLFRKEVV